MAATQIVPVAVRLTGSLSVQVMIWPTCSTVAAADVAESTLVTETGSVSVMRTFSAHTMPVLL